MNGNDYLCEYWAPKVVRRCPKSRLNEIIPRLLAARCATFARELQPVAKRARLLTYESFSVCSSWDFEVSIVSGTHLNFLYAPHKAGA